MYYEICVKVSFGYLYSKHHQLEKYLTFVHWQNYLFLTLFKDLINWE